MRSNYGKVIILARRTVAKGLFIWRAL